MSMLHVHWLCTALRAVLTQKMKRRVWGRHKIFVKVPLRGGGIRKPPGERTALWPRARDRHAPPAARCRAGRWRAPGRRGPWCRRPCSAWCRAAGPAAPCTPTMPHPQPRLHSGRGLASRRGSVAHRRQTEVLVDWDEAASTDARHLGHPCATRMHGMHAVRRGVNQRTGAKAPRASSE